MSIEDKNKTLVVVESPYAGKDAEAVAFNVAYGRLALHDCLMRGEAPFASHLLYAQDGVLDDNVPSDRKLGMEAGFAWGKCAAKTVVYTDLGVSKGMVDGIQEALKAGRSLDFRSLQNERACGLCANDPYGVCEDCADIMGEGIPEKRVRWLRENHPHAPVVVFGDGLIDNPPFLFVDYDPDEDL